MIDARIRDAYQTPDGVVLELEPRRTAWGWSCTGSRELVIRNATWVPKWGLSIMGDLDKDLITIGSNPPHIYRRIEASVIEEVR